MKKIFFWIAVIGWVLSVIVHLLSFANIDSKDFTSYIWLLHIGIFVVWFPAVLYLRKNPEFQLRQKAGFTQRKNPSAFLKSLFSGAPNWLSFIAIAGFYYAIVNFIIFILTVHGTPSVQNGQFVLQNHGQFIRTLTEKEYHHYNCLETRGFS